MDLTESEGYLIATHIAATTPVMVSTQNTKPDL